VDVITPVMSPRILLHCLLLVTGGLSLVSCASDEAKRRERVPPSVSDSTLPWNRPPKWEGSARYGSMMPQSR
jgi:hypothetical protein